MPPTLITLDYAPDTAEADAALADIVDDIHALRIPSDSKLNLYALERQRAHQASVAKFEAVTQDQEQDLHSLFAALRAEVGDPLPLASDGGDDVFDHLKRTPFKPLSEGGDHDAHTA